jgi:hypothetical protein
MNLFQNFYKKLDNLSKLQKLFDLLPIDHVEEFKLASIKGYEYVVDFFKKKYTKTFKEYQLKQLYAKPVECNSFTEFILSKINFYESVPGNSFKNYISFIEPLFDSEQKEMYDKYQVKSKEQLIVFAKMYDEYSEIKKKKGIRSR